MCKKGVQEFSCISSRILAKVRNSLVQTTRASGFKLAPGFGFRASLYPGFGTGKSARLLFAVGLSESLPDTYCATPTWERRDRVPLY